MKISEELAAVITINQLLCQNFIAVMVRGILAPQAKEAVTSTFFGLLVQFCSMEDLEIKSITVNQHTVSDPYYVQDPLLDTELNPTVGSLEFSGKEQQVNSYHPM